MRFESVTAYAFGALTDKTLNLAPGMTVIYGPNESGKSTWHAALYAGLCGMRRGRGQPTTEERDFAERHRPWEGQRWEVSARVQLDNARRVELRHDLVDRAGSEAIDLTLGRDITNEIINDGSPDGAGWLGLNRRSFQATACVRQADILSILGAAEILEQHLARAAATARTDATAAEAITRLERFRDTCVGSDRAPTRPLRRAHDRVRAAETRFEQARTEHQGFLLLMTKAEALGLKAVGLREELRLHESAAAVRDAQAWEQRAARARELSARFREGPPAALAEDDELAQKVAAAIAAWEGRPRVPDLQGLSAEELQRQIEALPPMPEGDLEPHPDVTRAEKVYEVATRSLELHDAARPPEPAAPAAGGASEQELLELARDLETPAPQVDPELQECFDRAKLRAGDLGARSRIAVPVVAGLFGTVAGVGLAVSGPLVVGLLVLIATGVLVAWMVAAAASARARALGELREAENAMGEAWHAVADVARRKDAARARAHALGVATDPASLRGLAEAVSAAAQQRREFDRWAERRRGFVEQVAVAERELASVLRTRGADVLDGIGESLERYLSQCADRARVALEAGRRAELESRLEARLAAEEARRRASDAELALRQAAGVCGVSGEDDDELCQGLKAWQQQRTAALEQHQTALQEWRELQTLLDGRTLEEIEGEARRKREAGTKLAEGLDPVRLSALSKAGNLDSEVIRLRREVEQASQDAYSTEGQVRERARNLPNVAEAEEELERATEELDRVLRLQRTLELTLQFLRDAQERAHRNIAPMLAQTVTRFLPEVTARRYTEAAVDPETLKVRVRDSDGHWRDAALLSHGTAEQVYLLLRVALAEHLTRPGETCPLILDDATVQSDRVRTEAIMLCLHAISRERQVIVFTQEDEVLGWAQLNLDGAQDRLIRLDGGA
jgi:exonuclease SbcC